MKQIIPFVLAIAAIVAACDANNANGPFTGTVKGTVKDTAGDPLVGVRVAFDSTTILHTASDGSWQVVNVPVGTGSVAYDSLPADCPTVPAQNYYLLSPGTTAQVNLSLACTKRH